jgi:RimJ/RimL family protein N-acetyltransferase
LPLAITGHRARIRRPRAGRRFLLMSTACVPVHTERLLLRAHRPADLDACAGMWNDPAVYRHISGKGASRFETWGKMLRYAGLWTLLGYGYWAVEERATGDYVGDLGFADFKRDIEPGFSGLPEIGWVFAPATHGRGYATEAARAAVEWADAHIVAPRSFCLVAPGNQRSIRVAEKVGYLPAESIIFGDAPTLVFTRPLGSAR